VASAFSLAPRQLGRQLQRRVPRRRGRRHADQAADLGEDRLWLESEVAQARDTSRLEASTDTGFPPSPASTANTSYQADSPPFTGFSPPSRSRFRPLLYPHPEEAEESEEEEGGDGGDFAGGAGRGLTETHPINPERSEFTEQVAYYEALLDTVDEYTQARGEVATGFRLTRSLQRTPPPRPGVAIADRAAPSGPSAARATGRGSGSQPPPDTPRGFQPRRTLARTPPTSSDRVLRSLPKPPPDGAPPRG